MFIFVLFVNNINHSFQAFLSGAQQSLSPSKPPNTLVHFVLIYADFNL